MSWKESDLAAEEFVAPNYDLLYASTPFAQMMYESFIADMKDLLGSGPVLDLACGTGYLTMLIKRQYPGLYTHCVDYSPKMLKQAENRCDECLKADIEDLPYQDNFFSCVYVHSALHHFESFDKILESVHKILKPGGYFLIQEPNESMRPSHFLAILYHQFTKRGVKTYPDRKGLEGGLTPSEHHGKIFSHSLVEPLKKSNFQVISVKQKFYATAYFKEFDSRFVFTLSKLLDRLMPTNQAYMFSIVGRKPSQ